jgi:predicted MFS family arabinose efflux permease
MHSSPSAQPSIARFFQERGIFYGWVVVVITWITVLAGAGLRQIPAVVIKPLEAEFGWDRASISLAVAVSLMAYGLGAPFSGKLIDRFGPRTVTLWALALTLVGAAGLVTIRTVLELIWWLGVVVGLGTGGLALVLSATVANRWFVTHRGLVTGLLAAGTSAGQLVFIPIMMALTLSYDWRAPVMLSLIVLAVIVLPLTVLLVRDSPRSIGLEPLGWQPDSSTGGISSAPVISMRQVIRTGDFWLLSASFFVCGVTTNGLIGTHLVPHAVEHGFSEYTAAGALALLGGMNVIGTTASGYLSDRVDPRKLLAIYYGVRAMTLLLLPMVNEPIGLTAFAIVFGLDWIATVPPTIALTADRFGRASVGTVFGWIFCCHQVGAAAASYAGGLAHDLLGDYQAAIIVAAMMGFIAAGISTRIARKPSVSAGLSVPA